MVSIIYSLFVPSHILFPNSHRRCQMLQFRKISFWQWLVIDVEVITHIYIYIYTSDLCNCLWLLWLWLLSAFASHLLDLSMLLLGFRHLGCSWILGLWPVANSFSVELVHDSWNFTNQSALWCSLKSYEVICSLAFLYFEIRLY